MPNSTNVPGLQRALLIIAELQKEVSRGVAWDALEQAYVKIHEEMHASIPKRDDPIFGFFSDLGGRSDV